MDISHNPGTERFAVHLAGGEAYVSYRQRGELMDIVSTWVPPEHRRLGIGEKLVICALNHAQANEYKVIPTCPFVPDVISAHPEYETLIVD